MTDLGPPPDELGPEPEKGSPEKRSQETSVPLTGWPENSVIHESHESATDPLPQGSAMANGATDADDATDLASRAAAATSTVVPTERAAAADVESGTTLLVALGSKPSTVVERAQNPGPLFWLTLTAGWAVIVFGVHGLISNWSGSNPPAVLRTVIGLNVVNDALVVPLVLGVAATCRRLLRAWLIVPVDVGLIMTAVVVLYSYPLVGGWGKSSRAGSSRLPWNYAHNVGVVIAVIWAVCALLALWRWKQARAIHP